MVTIEKLMAIPKNDLEQASVHSIARQGGAV
jgi:hypothetical protein